MDFGVEHCIRRHLPAHSWRGKKTSAALGKASEVYSSVTRCLWIRHPSFGNEPQIALKPAIMPFAVSIQVFASTGSIINCASSHWSIRGELLGHNNHSPGTLLSAHGY